VIRRAAKVLLVISGIVVICLTVLAFVSKYKEMFSQHTQMTDVRRTRERMLFQFTASADMIAFPVAVNEEAAALAVINRMTGHRMLVSSGRDVLGFPQFSTDGKRILIIKENQTSGDNQLLSCTIDDWKCRILTQSPTLIRWPVEVRNDIVLYAHETRDGRRRYYDFDLVELYSRPFKLSSFELYNVVGATTFDHKIMFATSGSVARNNLLFPSTAPLARASSEIFTLDVDWSENRLIVPSRQLESLYVIDGFSTLPTVSADGTKVAFLNRRLIAGLERYNLVIATINGEIQRYIEASTKGFSRPAFVGHSVLANQLFDDRYETTLIDQDNSARQIAMFDVEQSALEVMERVEIRIVE